VLRSDFLEEWNPFVSSLVEDDLALVKEDI
jgi:hypothetical protein